LDQLPSGTGGFGFQAAFEARWRVESATEVVRRNITGIAAAEAAVRSEMRELLWPHAQRYGIESVGELARSVRSELCGRPHTLDVGLVVTDFTVRLYLDQLAAEHLRRVKQREFELQLAAAQHKIDKVVQDNQAELQRGREQAILAAARGEGGLILAMIAQDPGNMREILDDLGRRHDIAADRKEQVLRDLLDAKLIQPAEARAVWEEMNRSVQLFGAGWPGSQSSASRPELQTIAGAASTPRTSKPPKPRFQGAGPQPTAHAAASQAAQPITGESGSVPEGDSKTKADTGSG
jgi:hypothetical protein